jgi:hypothetical protein
MKKDNLIKYINNLDIVGKTYLTIYLQDALINANYIIESIMKHLKLILILKISKKINKINKMNKLEIIKDYGQNKRKKYFIMLINSLETNFKNGS